jgi:HlyD family secretion protein
MYRTTGRRARAVSAIGALVALATTGCSTEPVQSATLRVDRGTVTTTVSASGTLVAISEQNLGFSDRGQVKELLVGVGAQVTAGQVLARLDDFAVQQTLAQEQATLAQQQAELDRARGGNSVKAAGRTLDQAKEILEATKEEVDATNDKNKSATDRARKQLDFDREVLERAEEELRRDQEDCDSDDDEDESTTTTTSAAPTTSAEADSDSNVTGASASTSTDPCSEIDSDITAVEDAKRTVLSSETSLDTAEHQEDVDAASGQVSIANAEQSVVTAENDQGSADVDRSADIAAQEAVVRNAEAAVKIAQQNVDNTVLHAPVAGVVSAINGTVGEFIDAASATTAMAPGSSAKLPDSSDDESGTTGDSAGGAFITLDNLNTFQLVVPFEESDAARVAVNQSVDVTVDAIPDLTAKGTVLSIAPSGTSSSGIVEYYATIVLADGADSRLRDGQTALADVIVETVDNVLRVPSAAVSRDASGTTTVQVRGEDGQGVPTPFEAGTVGDEYTQVASGLREGQELLLPQTQQASSSDSGGGPPG